MSVFSILCNRKYVLYIILLSYTFYKRLTSCFVLCLICSCLNWTRYSILFYRSIYSKICSLVYYQRSQNDWWIGLREGYLREQYYSWKWIKNLKLYNFLLSCVFNMTGLRVLKISSSGYKTISLPQTMKLAITNDHKTNEKNNFSTKIVLKKVVFWNICSLITLAKTV